MDFEFMWRIAVAIVVVYVVGAIWRVIAEHIGKILGIDKFINWLLEKVEKRG
ncbi:MAG: hypothetical protein JXO44_04445 [Clostridia bacterium]|nr:hypothetical protein [Clostridia bacterium]